MKVPDSLKYLLTRIGSHLSSKTIYYLDASINFLEVGRWLHDTGLDPKQRFDNRWQLFDLVGAQLADQNVLYLEFGVSSGSVTRYWCQLLRSPHAIIHGFDSFEGLPEDWILHQKGDFSAGGALPDIDDARVQFFKGWFEQTLPNYTLPAHENLVIIMDADLYSSTSFVLKSLEKHIILGTYIYFDEFNVRNDELRAFGELLARTDMKFSLVGATRTLHEIMFQRVQ